jgi:hypothetical protein
MVNTGLDSHFTGEAPPELLSYFGVRSQWLENFPREPLTVFFDLVDYSKTTAID